MAVDVGKILQVALPFILSAYKEHRDANPNQPMLTDEQISELALVDFRSTVQKADAFLALSPSHPGDTVSTQQNR